MNIFKPLKSLISSFVQKQNLQKYLAVAEFKPKKNQCIDKQCKGNIIVDQSSEGNDMVPSIHASAFQSQQQRSDIMMNPTKLHSIFL